MRCTSIRFVCENKGKNLFQTTLEGMPCMTTLLASGKHVSTLLGINPQSSLVTVAVSAVCLLEGGERLLGRFVE